MGHAQHLPQQEDEALRLARETLTERIARWTANNSLLYTDIPALVFSRWETPTEQACHLYEPCLCLIAQGAKRVVLGKESYTYDAHRFLITSVDLPVVAQIIEASKEKPFLGLVLRLDRRMIAQMLVDKNLPLPREPESSRGIAIGEVTLPMLSAFERLIDLLDQAADIPILSPLILQEILYRLLMSDQGPRLRRIGATGSQSQQIAQAIDWLKDNYAKHLRVEELAASARMSPSTFHRHFRALTAMSPLQYQKKLRLHAARRIMLTERLDAASAAFQVGYESHSQFNREYSRLFGAPPLRDIKNLRQISGARSGD